MTPEPVTPPDRDAGIRTHSVSDLETTLVRFLSNLLGSYRLDNPLLNVVQGTRPEHPIEPQPPFVPYDPTQRAQTLTLKVPPLVVRGRVPRTVTGEINLDKLPHVPAVSIQAVHGKADKDSTIITVRTFVTTYDENPDSAGYQDVQNILEAMTIALTSFGQAAIDKAYPIVLPIEWKLIEPETFPHYLGEMTTQWTLPSGRPLPDPELGIIPAESIEPLLEFRPL